MFTGIIQAVGQITDVKAFDGGVQLTVDAANLDMGNVILGDSIAHNGACMTVIELIPPNCYKIDVSNESLRCTVGLDKPGSHVNLEKALRLGDMLGGHMVSGHVDGVGKVLSFDPIGENRELRICAPQHLAKYLAAKGSVVVNGVSLTTNTVKDTAEGCIFSINLIPHTLSVTTLGQITAGAMVNLEIDLIARYVERMVSLETNQGGAQA
ncbi:riboflavin synthase [Chitinibacter bivalviorum]|uniref:Riboflavin synthase n=1 Tax=Chitinibacter bivalviorum TaxID=2739434 RepID=A0A7H9BGS0_9NEIS|nr:riboflavin synthase [Chitinibacter bivalviorum]QLG87612.1 riboflavin synthase [Chitinibacter bivalviorum]